MALHCFRRPDPAKQKSILLDKQIKKWHKDYNGIIKILLLGAGETGKTTILKQMKILHINGFTQEERMEKALEIRQNILQAILEIIETMSLLQPNAVLQTKENEKSILFMQQLKDKSVLEFSQEFYNHAASLWGDTGFKDCLVRASQFPLMDSTKYLLDRLETIRADNFIPSDQDILHSRKRTPDINKVEFSVRVPKQYGGGSQSFWMFDVGGQRQERHKWIQVFEGISAVLFVIGCSSFDSHIREDLEVNALNESINLFDTIWNSRFLTDSGVILFLNKQDLLEEKIRNGHSLGKVFDDFKTYEITEEDGNPKDEFHRSRCYIRDKFLKITKRSSKNRRRSSSIKRNDDRDFFWHYTIATDTKIIKRVFDDVHTMIVLHNLRKISPT